MIEKIVSGGQTGVDRGGLDAAIHCKVPHGGWCPKGRRSEDDGIPQTYQLQEHPSIDYIKRTEANVVDSDATLLFTFGAPTGGSKRTVELAEKHKRPCLCVDFSDLTEEEAISVINEWLHHLCLPNEEPRTKNKEHLPRIVLNIAGSRQSKAPGIAMKVMRVMTNVLNHFNHCGNILYPQKDESLRLSAR